jgi:hypothetical protein
MIFYVIIFLFFLLIFSGIAFLFYWIPKRFGYPKVGKVLAGLVGVFFIVMAILTIFEDQLFSKRDAIKLLSRQEIVLNDDFELINNESMSAIGDYYHTFTLRISESDKERIVHEIVSAKDFNKNIPTGSYFSDRDDYYNGPKRIKYYETETRYIKELFEPQGKGYAPTYRKIGVDKDDNLLIFEDIDE